MRLYFSIVVFCFFYFTKSFSQSREFVINDLTNGTGITSVFKSIPRKDKSIVIVANTYFIPTSVNVLKIDSSGNIVWSKLIFTKNDNNNIHAFDIIETLDRGFLISGYSFATMVVQEHAEVIKLDSMGNLQWAKEIEGSAQDRLVSAIQQSDSSYIITGSTASVTGIEEILIVRLDKNGNMVWMKTCDWGVGGNRVISTNDGGWAILSQYSFMKFDLNDSLQWTTLFGIGPQGGVLFDFTQTSDAGYVFGGVVWNPLNDIDNFILKLDSSGNREWSKYIDVSDNDGIHTVVETSDKGILVCSDTSYFLQSSQNPSSGYVFKLDSSGNLKWSEIISDSVRFFSAVEMPDKNILISGETRSHGALPFGMQMFLVVCDSSGITCSNHLTAGNIFSDTTAQAYIDPTIIVQTISLPIFPDCEVFDATAQLTLTCGNFLTRADAVFPETNNPVTVYPNPSSGVFHFQDGGNNLHLNHIEIFDISGRLVYSQNLINNLLDISFTQNGFYFYKLRTIAGNIFKGKLLVE